MKARNRIFGSLKVTLIFILILLASSMVTVAFEEAFGGRLFDLKTLPLISVILAGLLGVFALMWVFFWRYASIGKLVRADAEELDTLTLKNRTVLITGYSPLLIPGTQKEKPMPDYSKVAQMGAQELCKPSQEGRDCLGPWQQNIRTLHALSKDGQLENVFVINPSIDQFDGFRQTMQAAFGDKCPQITLISDPKDPSIPFKPKGITPDYDNFHYVYGAIQRAVKLARRIDPLHSEIMDEKITLDITPGQKPYTMAASIATLNSNMVVIYVTDRGGDLNDLGFRTQLYDATIEVGNAPF